MKLCQMWFWLLNAELLKLPVIIFPHIHVSVENAVTSGVIQELMQKIDQLNRSLNQEITDRKQLNEILNQKTSDLSEIQNQLKHANES